MKKSSLYFKLAFQNIKNNRKFYIPYLIAGMFTSMMCYILFYLLRDDTLNDSYDGDTLMVLREFMYVGIVITAIFSVIVVFYTNSFLIKRRKRELGLYNILGMQKRNLAWIQVIETAAIAIVSVLCGVLCGILFAKLTLLLLCKITGFDAPFGFHVDFVAIAVTALIFAAIYFLVLVYNVIQVGRARPIDLLRSEKVGQKPPKAKWALTVIGVLCLGAGYVMSLITDNIFYAITLFLIAVVLVIIGTYCLFTSGSITMLKAMQKNKRYYYKTAHFTGVSGMIYRMKANAVGLANICILSTMVLVTVSTTVALNMGAEDSINTNYPYDISYGIGINLEDEDSITEDEIKIVNKATKTGAYEFAAKNGFEITEFENYSTLEFTAVQDGNDYSAINPNNAEAGDELSVVSIRIIPLDDYNKLTGRNITLKSGEVLLQTTEKEPSDRFTSFKKQFTVKSQIDDHPCYSKSIIYTIPARLYVMTYDDMMFMANGQKEVYDMSSSIMSYTVMNTKGADKKTQQAMYQNMYERRNSVLVELDSKHGEYGVAYRSDNYCKATQAEIQYAVYGGFLFLGIFFGLLFTMAAVMIIYYKQISEGYDDKERFAIMQKVGMSEKEVKKTIHSQVLTVFFLPLCVAVIHLCVAFKMIKMLLYALMLTNVWLYVGCMAVTVLVFAVIYSVVYALTARSYYKIVQK
ncbi:MAG: ABC transporter permease [Acutalibacteraceae bacterium]|nr:ABC transporter permease [Acutalibacteraceae bacterium]